MHQGGVRRGMTSSATVSYGGALLIMLLIVVVVVVVMVVILVVVVVVILSSSCYTHLSIPPTLCSSSRGTVTNKQTTETQKVNDNKNTMTEDATESMHLG